MTRQLKEVLIKNLFALLAFVAVLVLGLIVVFLFREGLPLFRQVSPDRFLFGTAWYPTYDPPEYGIWPLIVGSFTVTLFSFLYCWAKAVPTAIGNPPPTTVVVQRAFTSGTARWSVPLFPLLQPVFLP